MQENGRIVSAFESFFRYAGRGQVKGAAAGNNKQVFIFEKNCQFIHGDLQLSFASLVPAYELANYASGPQLHNYLIHCHIGPSNCSVLR